MGWLAVLLLILAVWNFFAGMGVMSCILLFFSLWSLIELMLKSYHGDGDYY
ncbi:membrane protein [Arthrobacter phage Atuin]|nr:membrane protein [Arthrobacter phage Atuin]